MRIDLTKQESWINATATQRRDFVAHINELKKAAKGNQPTLARIAATKVTEFAEFIKKKPKLQVQPPKKKKRNRAERRADRKLAEAIAAADQSKKVRSRKQPKAPIMVEGVDVTSKDFLSTYAWRRLRMEALKKYGPKCMCCGATPANGAVMNVDHIKPRKFYPNLALDLANTQILCHDCNHGKGNWDKTDWRPESA
jgi:5-methylcytosine-specific restriction endonuclease McrA